MSPKQSVCAIYVYLCSQQKQNLCRVKDYLQRSVNPAFLFLSAGDTESKDGVFQNKAADTSRDLDA